LTAYSNISAKKNIKMGSCMSKLQQAKSVNFVETQCSRIWQKTPTAW